MRLVSSSPRRSRSSRTPRSAAERLALSLLALLMLSLILAAVPATLSAQPLADTLITWRGYARESEAHVAVYPAPPDDERRDRTIVVRELARSKGPSTLTDVRYLADRIARAFQIDPARAYWIMHWGAFSYPGATGDKELFLRVTFRRSDSGRLSSPYWRSISKNDVRELTDRRYQSNLSGTSSR